MVVLKGKKLYISIICNSQCIVVFLSLLRMHITVTLVTKLIFFIFSFSLLVCFMWVGTCMPVSGGPRYTPVAFLDCFPSYMLKHGLSNKPRTYQFDYSPLSVCSGGAPNFGSSSLWLHWLQWPSCFCGCRIVKPRSSFLLLSHFPNLIFVMFKWVQSTY